MKYIKFTVRPAIGKTSVVIRRFHNAEKMPPLGYTWKTGRANIESSAASQREYYNYSRREPTGYEDLVEVLR